MQPEMNFPREKRPDNSPKNSSQERPDNSPTNFPREKRPGSSPENPPGNSPKKKPGYSPDNFQYERPDNSPEKKPGYSSISPSQERPDNSPTNSSREKPGNSPKNFPSSTAKAMYYRLLDIGLSHDDAEEIACTEKLFLYAVRAMAIGTPDQQKTVLEKKVQVYRDRQSRPDRRQQLMDKLIEYGMPEDWAKRAIADETLLPYVDKLVFLYTSSPKRAREQFEKIRLMLAIKLEAKRNRVVNKEYITYNRLLLLALVTENAGISTGELAEKSGITKKSVRTAMNQYVEMGRVKEEISGQRTGWTITNTGHSFLLFEAGKFLQCELQETFSNTHQKNFPPGSRPLAPLSELIQRAQGISKQLKELGFYPWTVRPIMRRHKLCYIQHMIDVVIENDEIVNKGGYLHRILSGTTKKERRIFGIANTALAELSGDVVDMFVHLAEDLSPRQFLHLALALRKRQRRIAKKGQSVSVGDVQAILGYIQKCQAGVRIYRTG